MSVKGELEGTALKIYIYLLESNEDAGVREIARDLGLPVSTVHYHLKSLEELGYVEKTTDGYKVAQRLKLRDYIVIGSRVIHRFTLYSLFFLGFAIGEAILIIQSQTINPDRITVLIATLLASLIFGIERLRIK
jgi:DNA-binding MarR family transcriptional regulator